ncbi:C40 family peptidase [Streptomyces sp. N35]|uniref:C40 family peptidase n=1 Tax=Streptomyces sp. N35 TaxID=2795730 RepID=UPI0027DD1CE6|nr:C40 family peptidase [Streptomyces sp. N35]
MGTLVVAGVAGPAQAEEPPSSDTIHTQTLVLESSESLTEAATATQQAADAFSLQAAEANAVAQAAKDATKARATAERAEQDRKAAEARRVAEARAKQAAEQAAKERVSQPVANTAARGAGTGYSPKGTAPTSGSVSTVVAFLRAQVGKPYVLGASGPTAYDCSSLVQAAFKTVGVNLPRVSQAQSATGTQVSLSNLQVGDILYWGSTGSAYHVGVYIGNGQYLDAANPRTGVAIHSLAGYPASGAVRVL